MIERGSSQAIDLTIHNIGKTLMPQTSLNNKQHRAILQSIAQRAMIERGLLPDFSAEALAELGRIQAPAMKKGMPNGTGGQRPPEHRVRDMRDLLWASIDNDDSRDLDQLTVAEAFPPDKVKILVAIADVNAVVKNGSAIDGHARHNTTSVYTAAETFPMLPEKISTDVTSLNFNEERLAIVIEMVIGADGSLQDSGIYQAWVCNHAKLAYNSLAAWLEGSGIVPEAVAAVKGLDENLRLQDQVTQKGNIPGHFGLAVKDYAHSTAPNRRYPDLLTQRLLKAALEGQPVPYSKDELDALAAHCTAAEDAANKVERQVGKSAAALLLESRIGEQFDSIVTGASEKGTWVRLLSLPVEGKLVQGFDSIDVGDRMRVQLIDTNVERGYIDFKKVNESRHR